MLRQLFTLVRGRTADASQAYLDANATALLRQQLREAAVGVEKNRKAVAVVMAYAEREKASLVQIEDKITDLEARACDALDKGADDMALEAATAIANLEAERDATQRTIKIYSTEIVQLRQTLGQNEALLSELKRGQRIAEATSKTQRLRGDTPSWTQSDLSDASETLKRLQERQQHNEATMQAMAELSSTASADALSDRMASQGFGVPKKTAAADVLARLKNGKE
ncbi:PspA/IM30 family protein [Sulfitobacter sp. F26204]|uniref:PspA/IM30 family protein n=1 Tax=Sulfitobacter sp. F26204 TaxID=2996014 RepID=UPI00225DECEE|nr:PspA/IM30 family protein [Sulfitobacter sp. F26204]MCX7559243.1 PspA/IM30 family protein [Sulfitobacter sp. F26204]